jgi:Metallopeptidase toxin 4
MSDVYKAAQQGDLLGMGVSAAGVMMPYGAGLRSAGRAPIGTLDAMDSAGRLGGKLYDTNKLGQLKRYLERRGVALQVGDEYVPLGKAGGFDSIQNKLILRDAPTEYEVWHEMSHFRQRQSLGNELYNLQTRAQKEQHVFDTLENSTKRWNTLNFEQQMHAIEYIERVGGFR